MIAASGASASGVDADRLETLAQGLEALTRDLEALAGQGAWPQVADLVLRQWEACQRFPLPVDCGPALHRRLAKVARHTRRALERARAERDSLAATLGGARREASAVRAYLRSEQH